MGNGWMGKILRVNLTDETVKTEPLNMEDARLYAGGRGLGTKYCADLINPNADPLGSENVLALMTGPLTGTLAPCAGMIAVVSKVPQSGEIGFCSSGGYFGPELKFAGWDGVIVEGKAKNPVYLSLHNDHAEIRNASHLWGRSVSAAVKEIAKEAGDDAKIACIDPSGENLDLSAAIINEKSRTSEGLGFGAVMGSKNLKAIVVKGTKSIRAAKNQEFLNSCLKARKMVKNVGQSADQTTAPVGVPDGWLTYLAGNWKHPCFDANGGCFGCFPNCGAAIAAEKLPFTGLGKSLKEESDWSLEQSRVVEETPEQKMSRNFMAFVCSVGICPSATTVIGLQEIAEMFRACTGFGGTDEEILQIGQRIRNLEMSFNRSAELSK